MVTSKRLRQKGSLGSGQRLYWVAFCPDAEDKAIPDDCASSVPLTSCTLLAFRNKVILIVVIKSDYQIAEILHITRLLEVLKEPIIENAVE